MKRTFIALTLIAICLFLCIINSYTVEKNCNRVLDILNQLSNAAEAEDIAAMTALIDSLEKEWSSIRSIFSTSLETELTEDVHINIMTLREYIEENNPGLFLVKIKECELYLEHISQWHKITLDKIL